MWGSPGLTQLRPSAGFNVSGLKYPSALIKMTHDSCVFFFGFFFLLSAIFVARAPVGCWEIQIFRMGGGGGVCQKLISWLMKESSPFNDSHMSSNYFRRSRRGLTICFFFFFFFIFQNETLSPSLCFWLAAFNVHCRPPLSHLGANSNVLINLYMA